MQLHDVVVHSTTPIIIRKCSHANPAYMGFTIYTHHVVAPSVLLNVHVAFGAGFDAVLFSPSAERIHAPFHIVPMLLASHTVVVFDMASGAYAIQTGSALQARAFPCRAIHNLAVGCGAMTEFIRSCVDVC